MALRRIALRVLATATAACCSSALAASLADSASTSIEPPSAFVAPTLRVGLRREGGGLDRVAGVVGAEGGGERAVEVHVHAAVAGRGGVGEVGREGLVALGSARDRAL